MKVEINKNMLVTDVLELDEEVGQIFLDSGLHCLGCVAASGETIEEACEAHGIDCTHLVDTLNEYFVNK